MKRILALLLVISGTPAALAQGTDEQWEVTVAMEMDGVAMPPMTQRICQRKGKMKPDQAVPMDSSCKMLESKMSGKKHSFKFVCDGPEGTLKGSGEMEQPNKTSYRGKMRMSGLQNGESIDVTQTFAGKRLGNCRYTDPASQAQAMVQPQAAQLKQVCDEAAGAFSHPMFVQVDPNFPAVCASGKAAYCANVKKVGEELRSPAAYAKHERNYDAWRESYKVCGNDPRAVAKQACASAQAQSAWPFIGRRCKEDALALRLKYCEGRDYSALDAKALEMCTALGFDGRSYTSEMPMERSAQPNPSGAQPKAPVKPSTPTQPEPNTVKEGAKKLKKLLNL